VKYKSTVRETFSLRLIPTQDSLLLKGFSANLYLANLLGSDDRLLVVAAAGPLPLLYD